MDSLEGLWKRICDGAVALNTEDAQKMAVFLSEVSAEYFDQNVLGLSTKSTFICERVERLYIRFLEQSLFDCTGIRGTIKIEYKASDFVQVDDIYSQGQQEASRIKKTDPVEQYVRPVTTVQAPTPSYHQAPQNNTFTDKDVVVSVPTDQKSENFIESSKTFETFVTGDSNTFAYSLARSVAELPGKQCNPLFIYGKSGLGKTHLLLAIKNFVNYHYPEMVVTYAQTITFVNDFTSAIQTKQWAYFSQRYRQCDVLLLDDIQTLEGKTESTNEIFNIFNAMTSQGRQVVLSADRSPNYINLDERFTSRFSQGIIADIKPPTFETKLAILKNCVAAQCKNFGMGDFAVPEEVYTRIIELSGSNIRTIEGAATTLVAHMSTRFGFSSISIEEAEQVVSNIFLPSNKKTINIKLIQREVESHYRISHEDMISSKRSHNISYPRQIAMYLARHLTDASYPDIGAAFGGKTHTSVIYAVNTIEKKRLEDIQTSSDIEKLINKLEE